MEEMTATATAQNAPLVSVIVATYNYGHFIFSDGRAREVEFS